MKITKDQLIKFWKAANRLVKTSVRGGFHKTDKKDKKRKNSLDEYKGKRTKDIED